MLTELLSLLEPNSEQSLRQKYDLFMNKYLSSVNSPAKSNLYDFLYGKLKTEANNYKYGPQERIFDQPFNQGQNYGYGLREDKTFKGKGYYGEMPITKNGVKEVFGEISSESYINGKYTLYPLVVPGLTKKELDFLASGKWQEGEEIPWSIQEKAYKHAIMRLKKGLSPFAYSHEEGKTPIPK